MHHIFFALTAHPDVAKLEFEDGILATATELLAEESGRRHVIAEIRRESNAAHTMDLESTGWDGTLLVSATKPEDVDVRAVGDSLAPVAVITSRWVATVVEGSSLDATWVGTAVPGAKLSFALDSARGVDTASFQSWLRNEIEEISLDDDFGSRALVSETDSGTTALVSIWFTKPDDLAKAVDSDLFEPVMSSSLIEIESVRTFTSIEHRLSPNPNAWNLPTGPLMPVRSTEDE